MSDLSRNMGYTVRRYTMQRNFPLGSKELTMNKFLEHLEHLEHQVH